jgi:prepilin-type N-terminal cleavage/methylation domain-containing protein
VKNRAASIVSISPTPPEQARRQPRPLRRPAFTLIEVLITIALLAILAAALIPQITGDIPERLEAAGQIVAADLEYACSLAVANNSSYRLTFDPTANRYWLQHTGSNNLLNVLPPSPFRQHDDPPDRQTTGLAELPLPQPGVRLIAVAGPGGGLLSPSVIDIKPLGGTLNPQPTIIWLGCGSGDNERFITVQIDPVTGLTEIGTVLTELPAAIASTTN